MSLPTSGQMQGLNELSRIIKVSDGGLGMEGEPRLIEDGAWLWVDLWVDCTGALADAPGSQDLSNREPLTVFIPAEFPFRYPAVDVRHERFAGLPHVQWGHALCLYAAANDWDPSEGMWGFIDRLLTWYQRAARGELAGPALPWHPPVTYGAGVGGVLIVRAELPGEYERNDAAWTCWAVLAPTGEYRFELRNWVTASAANGGGRLDGLHRHLAELNRAEERGFFAAPLVALPESLGFEYPRTIGQLAQALADHKVDVSNCADLLRQAYAVNNDVLAPYPADTNTPPLVLLLGSPAADRTVVPGRTAHLAAWRVENTRGNPVSGMTPLDWMKVYDQRPQSTTRRDATRPVQWLSGRRVLILGCGALGAPIAEHCVRAGVDALTLIDNGGVNPGILVRQPYEYSDIGLSKAYALSGRLGVIAPQLRIDYGDGNALNLVTGEPPLSSADLVIDATADRAVAAKLERWWWAGDIPCPVLSVMAGHRSEHGLATLALHGSTGAGADILRRFAVAASSVPDLRDVLDDFYPDLPRSDEFQPEPGCSDPTFVGSAADLAILAAQLLNAALTVLSDASSEGAHRPTRSATVVRLPTGLQPHAAGARLDWGNDVVHHDEVHKYEVRFDQAALAGIRREVLRAAAVDRWNETGGVLLGQVDHGCRVVWVSEARGMPPNSQAASDGLRLNLSALRGELAERRRSSRGLVSLVGVWHSHPRGPVTPSRRDRDTMFDLVNGKQETLPQALLVVVGGIDGRWQEWIEGSSRPDMHVELFFPAYQ